MAVDAAAVTAARERIKCWSVETPLLQSHWLSRESGGRVYLKLENLQRTGAFKFRGALNALTQLEPGRHVVTASSGNHGLGMALAGKLLGLPVTVVMPVATPAVKADKAREFGAEVILKGRHYDESAAAALQLAGEAGHVYIPSFDHEAIMAGQGTIGLELQETVAADVWVAPVGGGGLLAGLILAAAEGPELIGVQAAGADSMRRSLAAGKQVRLQQVRTAAEGIAVAAPGALTLRVIAGRGVSVVTVRDEDLLQAAGGLLHEEKVVAEAAGAAAVAAVRTGVVPVRGRTAVLVVTGGNASAAFLPAAMEAWWRREGTPSTAEK